MPSLFISYRRDDSAAWAGRLCDHMKEILGRQRVFMDVDGIAPGQDFAQAIEQTLTKCSHVLVVIGPQWHNILLARAQSGTEDYVAHEIAAAIKLKKTVVPVFVGGATAAALTALPATLKELPFHQALELRDASFNDDCNRLANRLRLSQTTFRMKVFAGVGLAIIAAAWAIFLGRWRHAPERSPQTVALLSTAKTQASEAEYEAAFHSYEKAAAIAPADTDALNGETDAAMKWVEDFHVLAGEGQKPEDMAAPLLAEIRSTLEGGLARTNGKDKRAADILAHLGWAHFLNEKIAFKEFGNAQRYFAQALAIDPANVFAHAFWGNWLMQTHGNSDEALKHFASAMAVNAERPLVRRLQLGGLLNNDEPGMRGEFVKALNQMRIGGEPLDEAVRQRTSYLYSPTVSSERQLQEVLRAVPPEEEWKSFLWLNAERANAADSKPWRDFIHANLTEISGNRRGAWEEFKAVKRELQATNSTGRMKDYTDEAIRRLGQ